MRVVALVAVRDEELFLARCLEHLYQQGIETCIIDNDSTDGTLQIAQCFLGRGVIRIEHIPYNGCFDLPAILRCKERLAKEIDADWFVHQDADEIREAPQPYKNMLEAIRDVDGRGYNAINFDEFVFSPTDDNQSYEGKDYVAEMQYYYFFEPYPLRRLNAWKNTGVAVDLVSHAGHRVSFEGQKVFPGSFVLKHYICLSRAHAIAKYGSRVFSLEAVKERGWSKDRASFTPEGLRPAPRRRLRAVSGSWDKSDPWLRHEYLFVTQNNATSASQASPTRIGSWIRQLMGRFRFWHV